MAKSPLEQTLTTIQPASLDGSNPLNPNPSLLSASSSPIATASTTPPSLTVSGNTSYTGTAPVTVAPNLTISGTDNFSGARVFIDENFNSSKDRLAVGNSTGNNGTLQQGIDWTYNPTTGVLSLNNSPGSNNITPATYQEVLRQVTYTNSDTNNPGNARKIQFSLGNLLVNPENGHFYQFVDNNGVKWTDAKTAAENLNYFGAKGYLATITSAAEQQFLNARIQANGWIGASDAATEGDWKWVTGPESGQSFWSGGITGSAATNNNVVSYTNWNDGLGGEPNNSGGGDGEDYGHVIGNPLLLKANGTSAVGKWNDLANERPADNYTPKGYIVEYGGLKGDPTLNITGSVTVSLSATTQANSTTPDFNKDGKPDLLWRNKGNGQNAVWVLNYDTTSADTGFTLNAKTKLIQQERDQGWKVAGLYDINKDNITDIFWRNYTTGENSIWLMKDDGSGIDIGPGSNLPLAEKDINWEIKGVADFDNDGTANILWRNERTGENAIWQVDYDPNASGNGFSVNASKSKLIAREPDTKNWVIQGWADFTGDKILDILWRNQATGENAVWKLNNNATGANPYFNLADSYQIDKVPVTDGWEIEKAIDFNKDGIADILWRNYNTGENSIWVMTAGGKADPAKTALIAPKTPTSWEIEGVADYTSDGTPDIVWRNYSTDENAIWRMKIDSNNRPVLDKDFALSKAGNLSWEIVGPIVNNDFN